MPKKKRSRGQPRKYKDAMRIYHVRLASQHVVTATKRGKNLSEGIRTILDEERQRGPIS